MEQNLDERTIRALEAELHVEILPGTEIMRDVSSKHFIHETGGSTNVLVPQPTNDPHDPLNWSPFWKVSAITATTFMSFTQGLGPLCLAPMFEDYIVAFNCTLAEAIQFTGVAILVLGFSNFVWVPLSTTYGRRFVMITSQLVNIASSIWRARAQTYGSFMGASALNGFAAGPAETLQPAIITDLFFLHDRGKWNTLYFVAYFGSLMIGPIISGLMSSGVGWRNFWWLNTATVVLSLIMIIFLYPETKYARPHPSTPTTISDTSLEKEEFPEEISKQSTSYTTHSTLTQSTTQQDPHLGIGTPSKTQWALLQPCATPLKTLAMDFWIPWKLFAYPIVEFASFVVSWSASSFLTLNLTQSQVFAAPPYNFSPTAVGMTNFAVLVGSLLGLATAGPLSDWVSMRATVKNNGIREPEMRLAAMIPYVGIMILGNVVVAVGYQYQWPWEVIILIGYTCAGIQVAALPAIASTYAVDSYKPVSGSLFVSITVNKNVWGYGFSKFITPWTIANGYIPPIMLNMALITLWCSFGILFYYKGKMFRRWSKNSKVHYM